MSQSSGEPTPEQFEEMLRRLAAGQLSPDDLARIQSEINDAFGMDVPPAMIQQAMAQMQTMMSSPDEGPVQWTLAEDTARQVAAAGAPDIQPDRSVNEAARRTTLDALRIADTWLDQVTSLPTASVDQRAWSRAEWVNATLPTWQPLCQPVAERVADTLTEAMSTQLPSEMQTMAAQASQMMRRMGGAVFGAQVGRAVGGLSNEVVSAHDIGLPLTKSGTIALVPANVDAFGEGLDVPLDEVRLYLALRESAYSRLFGHANWLRAKVLATVEDFARGITIDVESMTEAIRSINPTDPEQLQQALSSGMFEPQRTPAQKAALERLETTLALIEGWVDEVTHAAATSTLPNAAKLREAVRRRRAVGGPAEHTLATLVGLELRPRRLRDAAALWAALAQRHGALARDEIWDHPELLPTTMDLDDPLGYVERYGLEEASDHDFDAELRSLLEGGAKPGDSERGGGDPSAPDEGGAS